MGYRNLNFSWGAGLKIAPESPVKGFRRAQLKVSERVSSLRGLNIEEPWFNPVSSYSLKNNSYGHKVSIGTMGSGLINFYMGIFKAPEPIGPRGSRLVPL